MTSYSTSGSDTSVARRYGDPIKHIGQGTAGKIFETSTGFAIKFLPFKYISEISLVRSLSHPNIIKFHKVEIENMTIKIYMDLYDCNLLTFSRRRILFPKSPLFQNIVWQMVQSVAYLASHGIVHRDIKPANFLIKNEGYGVNVVLADFDFAIAKDYLNTNRTNQIYTLSYRPPEIHLQIDKPSFKSDIWALAISIIDVLFCGQEPREKFRVAHFESELISWIAGHIGFPDKSCRIYEKFMTKLSGDEDKYDTLIDKISCPRLQNLLSSMLKIDPDDRLTIVEVCYHEFFAGMKMIDDAICQRQDGQIFRKTFDFDPHLDAEISANKAMQFFVKIAIDTGVPVHLIHTTLNYFTRYIQKVKIANFYAIIQACHYLAHSFAVLEGRSRFPFSNPQVPEEAAEIAKVLHDDFSAMNCYDEILSKISSPTINVSIINMAIRLLTLAGQFYFLYTRDNLSEICFYLAKRYHEVYVCVPSISDEVDKIIDRESIRYYLNKIGFGIVDIGEYIGKEVWDKIYTLGSHH